MLHHVGILCGDITSKALLLVLEQLGHDDDVVVEYVEEYACTCIMLGQIELVVPNDNSPLHPRLAQVGTSIHHIALRITSMDSIHPTLKGMLLHDDPVTGVGGILVNFIRPKFFGILIELVEDNHGS